MSNANAPPAPLPAESNKCDNYLEVFESYWIHCLQASTDGHLNVTKLAVYVDLIGRLLTDGDLVILLESGQCVHLIFEAALKVDMFNQMYEWHEYCAGVVLEDLKVVYLRFYDSLISSSCFMYFIQKEFLVPMMACLSVCSRRTSLPVESMLLQTLHDVCVALHKQAQWTPLSDGSSFVGADSQDLFWSICLNPSSFVLQPVVRSTLKDIRTSIWRADSCVSSSSATDVGIASLSPDAIGSPHLRRPPFASVPSPPFADRPSTLNRRIKKPESICDLLVPFVHRDGSFSWLSRDCLLLLTASSSANLGASYQIAKNSNLCEVLITDMVLQFNILPRSLAVEDCPEQWSNVVARLQKYSQKGFPLSAFLDHFGFCCSIFDVSNYLVKETMLNCLHRGFLLPVLAPALLQTPGPETATATAYLECFLRHAAGSAILPFLLRFLLSDCTYESSPVSGGGVCPWSEDLFRQGTVSRVLERSFSNDGGAVSGLGGPSFGRPRTSLTVQRSSTYMDVFLRRLHFCDTLTGIATLSLISTLLDFFCEDFTFELILKYLMPLADQPAVRKLLSTPNTLLFSASQFLTLIPPYLKPTGHGESDLDKGENGGEIQKPPTLWTMPNFSTYLNEAHRLVTERSIACSSWSFPYNFESPSPSQVAAAHLSGTLLLPLPRDGYKVSQVDSTSAVDFMDGNWELDEIALSHGDAPDDSESTSLLADLDRFSALLQRPSPPTSNNRSQSAVSPLPSRSKLRTHYSSIRSNSVVPAAASANQRRSYYRSARDAERLQEDIKRTSSLYDITYTDFDEKDEETEDARTFATNVPKTQSVTTPPAHTGRLPSDPNFGFSARTAIDRQPSSATDLDSLLDEAAGVALQHCLAEGQPEREDIMEEFMDVLDRLPTAVPVAEDSASTEEILAQMGKTAEKLLAGRSYPARGLGEKEEEEEVGLKPPNIAVLPPKPSSILTAGSRTGRAVCPPCNGGAGGGGGSGSDSGVVSLDRQSGRHGESASSPAACCSNFCLRSSRADSDIVPLYPGPLLSVLLQLLARLPLNHFFVNLLVTSVIAKLVAFPIPILRTLLLTVPVGSPAPPSPGPLRTSSDCGFALTRRDLTSEFPRSMPLQLHNFLFSVRQWMDCYVNLNLPEAVSSPSASTSSVGRGKKSASVDPPGGFVPHLFAQISASVRALLSNKDLRNFDVVQSSGLADTGHPRRTSFFKNWKKSSNEKPISPPQTPTKSPPDWCIPTCPDLDTLVAGAFHDQPMCNGFDNERSRHIILSCLVFEDFCMELAAICLEQSALV
ncbi:hypothetical protein SprV_0100090100 [Sparganum proliferum]